MNSNSEDNDLNARLCALELISAIIDKRTTIDHAFDQSVSFSSLPQRDRNFTKMVVTTTIRRLGQIDDLINFTLDHPDKIKIKTLRHILRLGVTQIFFMEVPDHAAVDTSVRLAEHHNFSRQKGFINAVLRRLIREGKERLDKQDTSRLNTPEWLLKHWVEDYGLIEAAKIAQANMIEPALDITVKNPEERAYWGNTLQASELSTGTLRRIQGGNIRDLEGFNDGKWWVQDAAAAIPALLFGEDLTGKHIIDLCAAPGGKTLQLVAKGATVTAIDRSAKRLKRLDENLKRMQLQDRVKTETADASVWKPTEPAQHILLDAPCSATGTLRRHPDTAYIKSEQDITRLMQIQEKILNHAATILDIGGTLIYCTCSLQKAEGEHQIETFLGIHSNFERIPIEPHEIGKYNELINEQGDLRILPYHLSEQGGIDGFFISRLKRNS